ncbi:ATP-binding cassette domain-containing protein [Gordonia sp. HY442]|uniref:ATP-binding cassette domain-containing protein n=1 Tax=Gordonia zhenghanii TaxID=2911516 RepID=UPI001EFFB503|nr:ATP-binding cassette domain-containing protein [Gordonia zhenghanii]MCF8607663.1 ATP-binding cassette domain-containing protein [Gordonia zhenghanii]
MTNASLVAAAVAARGLRKNGPSGSVFGPIDLDVPAGGVTVLRGPSGSGRTCLLLTLAGRMKPKSGELSVFGKTTPKRIFKVASIGAVDDLDAVYDSVRVIDLVTEKLRWDAPWYRFVGKRAQSVQNVCGPVWGPLPLPDPRAFVEDLSELEVSLLRIALANTRRTPLLVVGGVDQLSSVADQRTLMQRLVELGRDQTVVSATSNPVDDDLGIRRVVEVPNLAGNDLVHGEGTN